MLWCAHRKLTYVGTQLHQEFFEGCSNIWVTSKFQTNQPTAIQLYGAMKLNTVYEEMMEAMPVHGQYLEINSKIQWFGICFKIVSGLLILLLQKMHLNVLIPFRIHPFRNW